MLQWSGVSVYFSFSWPFSVVLLVAVQNVRSMRIYTGHARLQMVSCSTIAPSFLFIASICARARA